MKRSWRRWTAGMVAAVAVLTGGLWTQAQDDGGSKEQTTVDWGSLRYITGFWHGTGQGTPGKSEVALRFKWILEQKFLFGQNTSVFEPTEAHPAGEVHDDWMIFSIDSGRNKIILRQFHNEGYVNQYVLEEVSNEGNTLRFVSESVENRPPGTRARLTFTIDPTNKELEQNFELAMPGKDFAPSVKTNVRWKRGT